MPGSLDLELLRNSEATISARSSGSKVNMIGSAG